MCSGKNRPALSLFSLSFPSHLILILFLRQLYNIYPPALFTEYRSRRNTHLLKGFKRVSKRKENWFPSLLSLSFPCLPSSIKFARKREMFYPNSQVVVVVAARVKAGKNREQAGKNFRSILLEAARNNHHCCTPSLAKISLVAA